MSIPPADAVPSVADEIANGDELRTAQIAREKNLQLSTILRWMLDGLPAAGGGRVRLAAIKRGRTWLTSRAALCRFFSALPTNASGEEQTAPKSALRPQTKRQEAISKAKDVLKNDFGI